MKRTSLFLALCLICLVKQAESAKPPNVVLILTDNHGAWTLGCYGNPEIRTPNIDRLASEGTLFTRAFASNPVCSPTRATMLTGLIPSQHGVHSFLRAGTLQTGPNARCTLDEFTSLPEILKAAGYNCGLVGKWHLGANESPQEGLDDYWITMPHGGTSTFYGAQVIENGKLRTEPEYLTDFWTRHAVRFIEQQAAEPEQPFFLFLAYNGPYALSRLLLRDGQNRHAEFYAQQPLLSFPRGKPHPWQLNNLDFINNPTSIRRVATEVSGVDDGVGEIMRTLAAKGLDKDTVVVFAADQGWVGGHGGFFGMGDHTRPLTARDGMMQIPYIWRHPGKITAGSRVDQMTANYDFVPTMLGYLGLQAHMPLRPTLPGCDLSRILTAEQSTDHQATNDDAVYYEFENLRCIRTESHKYVHRHPNGPHELYDLVADPDEFTNLVNVTQHTGLRDELKRRMDRFYDQHASPKYDLWNGGISQAHLHDGIDEELAQLTSVNPPPLPSGFQPAPIELPEGYSARLVAGPPLVTHPTMGCLDDQGRLYVCNNAGVNMTNDELEAHLPNAIHRLVDSDDDGTFDSFTVFADKMTFPMGGVWHDGSLYVASPPNIWKLTDTDDDGVADERKILVSQFGYNGNAASIHGCFFGPDGRLYWTDGYHGHEFTDESGQVVSSREGSYLFSCKTDGTDRRIHCGGGMDNPVEIDFTDSGDMLGTVNILYTRPRVDCLVHWLHGGTYPHRERVLKEVQVTGDLLGPAHRFGHVAVSGITRYRSGVMDHSMTDDLFVTFFNSGKVVRLSMQPEGSTYRVTQHEFLHSPSREFHPTDVIEDADGSLLVIDTGGWFYRGCPTSQFAKPDLLGGIYRISRDGMTRMVDPRGRRIDWTSLSVAELIKLFNDTRHSVRQQAVDHCVSRGRDAVQPLETALKRADIRIRTHAIWALTRLGEANVLRNAAAAALHVGLRDSDAAIRQAACYGLGRVGGGSDDGRDGEVLVSMLSDPVAAVRRQAATSLGMIGNAAHVAHLLESLSHDEMDRSEEHAIVYALLEIGRSEPMKSALSQIRSSESVHSRLIRGLLVACDQMPDVTLQFSDVMMGLNSDDEETVRQCVRITSGHPEWSAEVRRLLQTTLSNSSPQSEDPSTVDEVTLRSIEQAGVLMAAFISQPNVAELAGEILQQNDVAPAAERVVLAAIRQAGPSEPHASWLEPLRERLISRLESEVGETIVTVKSMRGNHFAEELQQIATNEKFALPIRVEAMSAIATDGSRLDDVILNRLIEIIELNVSPRATQLAAQAIADARLSSGQMQQVTPLLTSVSPAELRVLLRVYARGVDEPTAVGFIDAIDGAQAKWSLAESELSDVVKKFPPATLQRANALLDQLKSHRQQRLARLEALRGRLELGDPLRGASVFVGEKAKCSSCHRIAEIGKAVGPDLTTIGANRSADDLLESIVFPSASIVRDYGTYQVLTHSGRVLTGLLVGETASSIQVQIASGETVTLMLTEIEQITPSSVSTMPAGLDESLSEQELLDVVSYLLRQK
ncbi:PVC-type heme-binding CxxCH protein [Stieleria varia]|uniref:Arylsulfatase n=1 Tax=Stieleria varia TaxID=2528005 RepID=A0A5C6APU7_9BACT|nr:PVC-type heme-binding CxxCH protein [Stieleria varia]TWU01249.1 Arylsulfatase [Stieleria varia]